MARLFWRKGQAQRGLDVRGGDLGNHPRMVHAFGGQLSMTTTCVYPAPLGRIRAVMVLWGLTSCNARGCGGLFWSIRAFHNLRQHSPCPLRCTCASPVPPRGCHGTGGTAGPRRNHQRWDVDVATLIHRRVLEGMVYHSRWDAGYMLTPSRQGCGAPLKGEGLMVSLVVAPLKGEGHQAQHHGAVRKDGTAGAGWSRFTGQSARVASAGRPPARGQRWAQPGGDTNTNLYPRTGPWYLAALGYTSRTYWNRNREGPGTIPGHTAKYVYIALLWGGSPQRCRDVPSSLHASTWWARVACLHVRAF